MDLHTRQLDMEAQYTSEGILRTINQWQADIEEGRIADTTVGRAITVRCYSLVLEALTNIMGNKTRGVGGKYRALIRDIGLDKAAIITLRTALRINSTVTPAIKKNASGKAYIPVVQDFISEVGNNIELEFAVHKLIVAAPAYTKKVIKSMRESRTVSTHHRTRTLRKTADNVGVTADRVILDNTTKLGIGKLLMEVAVHAGIIETYQLPTKFYQHMLGVKLTATVEASLHKMVQHLRANILFPPSLIPPVPHTKENCLIGSSYLTPEMYTRAPTINLKSKDKASRKWVQESVSDGVIQAANTAANVPYILDSALLKRLKTAWDKVGAKELAGIPGKSPIEPPEYPMEEGWNRDDPVNMEIHETWKALAKEAYSKELERKSKALQFHLCLKYMVEFKEDTLYFPTFFDWRGRLYFRTRINPQGPDFVKACIKLKEAKPLGKEGVYWLKVHIATCYGYDKAAFDTRAAWVDKNIEAIRIAVQDDIDSEFFLGADSPWCFLVAAQDYLTALDSGKPEAHTSQIPVAMDATCSGLQVFSALLRDPVGGMMVNLLPNDGVEKEDIYAAVAGIAIGNIQKDTENLEMAQYWITAGVPRAMAKRPVMTYVYGGTLSSCAEYILEKMVDQGLEALPLYSTYKLSLYASKHVRKGVELAVPSAAAGMRFLREIAGNMPVDTPLRWITPAGFPVCHIYNRTKINRVILNGLGIQVSFLEYIDGEMDRKKSINGIAPNFIHSLDSSHLVEVLLHYEGCIVPIHDSFATHACDVAKMHTVLRERFVHVHKNHKPLEQLTEYLKSVTGKEIAPPPMGTLNIDNVMKSQFFMC